MKTNKPLMVAGLIAAISMGSIGIAEASPKHANTVSNSVNVAQVDPDAAVLAKLVTAGTITQAQSTIILAALQAAHPALPPMGGGKGGKGPGGFNLQEDINVVTTTLGITAAQLQTSLASGQTLAFIAGAKTPALITALVAAETTEINARVTSGAITQAQATTMIAGLNATITTIVNTPLPVGGPGHGGMGHGHGMHGGMGAPSGTPGAAPSN